MADEVMEEAMPPPAVVMVVGIMEAEDTVEGTMLIQSMFHHLCITLPIHIQRQGSILSFPCISVSQ
jgi:hypothetical protein